MTGSERFENPSAGKFDPPPGQDRFEAPKSRRPLAGFGVVFLTLFWIARIGLDHVHLKGWMAGLVGLGILGIGVADYILRRKLRDARRADGGDPYSPPQHLTH